MASVRDFPVGATALSLLDRSEDGRDIHPVILLLHWNSAEYQSACRLVRDGLMERVEIFPGKRGFAITEAGRDRLDHERARR